MARAGQVINLAGSTPIDDPEYRYKMSVVYGKVEGRGNGIKTVIPNISDVGTSLHRDPGEVNKFFGCELGAQTTYNVETDRAVVNGAHTDAVLQQSIKKYVDIFVLCPSCSLPETEYKIKNGCVFHKCAACGAKEMVDMSHKLCTYILAQDKKKKKEGKKKDKKKGADKDKDAKEGADGEKVEKEKKSKKKSSKDKDKGGSDDDEKKKKKKDKKKEKKDKKKKDKKEKSDSPQDSGAAGGDELSGGDDAESIDDAGVMDLAVEGTRKYLVANPDASPAAIAEVVVNQQMASALKSQDKVHIFVRAVISPENCFKEKQIPNNAANLTAITQNNPIMERHLIAAMEGLCVSKPKNFPVMLKQLFDEDALEEDVILEWACEGRNEYTLESVDEETRCAMRGEAEPVVVWLQDEDSDSDDDESDDDE